MKTLKKIEIVLILGTCVIKQGLSNESPFGTSTYYHGDTNQKVVYLVFHDGPNPKFTSQILDTLKKKNVKASFFLIGKNVKKYPEIARRIISEGHLVGNHTYSHPHLERLNTDEIVKEILKCERIILKSTGVKPKFFAAPYCHSYTPQLHYIYTISKKCGYININWSVDGEDWEDVGSQYVVKKIVNSVHNGSIILLHDGATDSFQMKIRGQTIKALPKIIDELKKRGFVFLLLDDLPFLEENKL
ncbi:MAG: polysaccharide deacetylase family protein [Candidatus Aenigmarchaeota archaeon]|nr:polysaccharide deacetylase family protein [Candidatus Aenigmarchaeota archaeon]